MGEKLLEKSIILVFTSVLYFCAKLNVKLNSDFS